MGEDKISNPKLGLEYKVKINRKIEKIKIYIPKQFISNKNKCISEKNLFIFKITKSIG